MRFDPAPVTVMPLPEIVTPVVQVQDPAGMVTVCPSVAVLMAVCTSDVLHDLALTVCALAAHSTHNTNPKNMDFTIFVITNPLRKPEAHTRRQ